MDPLLPALEFEHLIPSLLQMLLLAAHLLRYHTRVASL